IGDLATERTPAGSANVGKPPIVIAVHFADRRAGRVSDPTLRPVSSLSGPADEHHLAPIRRPVGKRVCIPRWIDQPPLVPAVGIHHPHFIRSIALAGEPDARAVWRKAGA